MQKASGIGRVQDCSDVNVTLGAGVDGYSITYDHASGKFILAEVSGVGISNIQDADDVNFSLGAGVDEYAVCWDNDTSKFVLRAVAVGSFLLSSGATVGAVDQSQAFTVGVKTGLVYPSSDGTAAIKLAKADGSTSVLTVDTTNSRVGINKTPAVEFDVLGTFSVYKPSTHDIFKISSTLGYRTYSVYVYGESYARLYMVGSTLGFGGGAAVADTFLARSGVGILKVSGNAVPGCLYVHGTLGVSVSSPTTNFDCDIADAVTSAVTNVATLRHSSSGTPAAGFGVALIFGLESTTTENQSAGRVYAVWSEATHATRKAQVVFTAYDTAEREGIRIGANGSAATLGLLGATPSAQLAHVADVKGDYAAGDLDSEAEVISMANALAAAINSLNSLVETFGFRALS